MTPNSAFVTLSLVLTTLLISACCALPNKRLSRFISHYDTLNYDPEPVEHIRRRRSVDPPSDHSSLYREPIIATFSALGRDFHLSLEPDRDLFGPNAYIEVGKERLPIDPSLAVRGKLHGNLKSHVYGAILEGVFRGSIIPDLTKNGAYHVEPAGNYFDTAQDFHSVIYHDDHVDWPPTGSDHHRVKRDTKPAHFCGWENPEIAKTLKSMTPHNGGPHAPLFSTPKQPFSAPLRKKREAMSQINYSSRVCNLYLQSDTYLWEHVMQRQHIKRDKKLAINEITSTFTQHVQGAQAIYQHALFETYNKGIQFDGVSFRVDRVRINTTEDDCSGGMQDTNPFCSPNIDVTNFLNLNSYVNHNDFCLAYVFTYRDFTGGTLGLAWVAEPGGSGGICEKYRLMREGNQDLKKSLNTGIVTLLNYGSMVALKVSQLTFAHEMGHNLGSKHDDDHKDKQGCVPSASDPRGNYIMFASATSGDKENNNQFSECSRDSIARLINQVINGANNCFKKSDGPFCGNKLQEEGEECDCGFDESDCSDQCCNPKSAVGKGCNLTNTISVNGVNKKVHCSPTAGECCTTECQMRGTIHLCRTAGECYNSSYCDGNNAKCPKSRSFNDGTPCQEHTRVCKGGECIGSICERISGWQECSLKRSEKTTDEMMCYVACKMNNTDAPCISTYQLEKDEALRKQYPSLTKELLRKDKGIQLKAGAPCDNYRGYCDVFSRCRNVEADGPLARLRNLIFSPQMLNKIKDWITAHWWAVILIALGLIVFMIAFVKVCAVHTPSSNPNQPRARKLSLRHHTGPAGPSGQGDMRQPQRRPPPQQQQPARGAQRGGRQPRPGSSHEMGPVGQAPYRQPQADLPPEASAPLPAGAPNYPPPAYSDIQVMQPPSQHGKGKGKKGHMQALNQQASKYKL